MENAILILVLAAIFGGAIAYIVKARRSGVKCIGCPSGGKCGQRSGSCDGCGGCGSSIPGETSGCECHEEMR